MATSEQEKKKNLGTLTSGKASVHPDVTKERLDNLGDKDVSTNNFGVPKSSPVLSHFHEGVLAVSILYYFFKNVE